MRKLTQREIEVLDMIVERLTVKEMAARQNVSSSAVNKRIATLKSLFGVHTHRALAAHWEHARGSAPTAARLAHPLDEEDNSDTPEPSLHPYEGASAGLRESACTTSHLPLAGFDDETGFQDERLDTAVLRDPMTFRIEAPWQVPHERSLVPGLLDGAHATGNRLLAIIAAVVLILAAMLIGLGVAQGLTGVLHG